MTTTGVYVHYKGGRYRVLFDARVSTNGCEGSWVVVYVSLTTGRVHARDVAEFHEPVGDVPRFAMEAS